MLGMMRVVTDERDFELINDDRSPFSGNREGASEFLPNTPFILLLYKFKIIHAGFVQENFA
jgi:hypothetical protein